jgi:hypothetical protein
MGLRAGLAPAAVCSAMWLRHSRGTFWPNQIWHSPDHLRREQLPAGNALVEGATFVAILMGTIAGELAVRDGGAAGLFAALVMSFAIAYWMAALFIPATGEGAPHLKVAINIAASTAVVVRHLRSDTRLWWGAMVTSWFWLIGIRVAADLCGLAIAGGLFIVPALRRSAGLERSRLPCPLHCRGQCP